MREDNDKRELPGAGTLHSPLQAVADRLALLEDRKGDVRGARTGSDPHVVTRGSGIAREGGQPPAREGYKSVNSGLVEHSLWDWYQSTVYVADPSSSGLVDLLLDRWELSDFRPAKNLNGYLYGGQIVRGDNVLCHLCWGGQTGVNCKTTSSESGVLAAALRDFGKEHRPTRVDARLDWQEEGLFDSLASALIAFAQQGKGLAINQQGDWTRGKGRTLYLGSTDSPVRLVLYEKGYEQGGDAPLDWVRLEVRVRPKKEHRQAVAMWEPKHAFEAGWCADACKVINLAELSKRSVGTVWKRSNDERARYALVQQYGKTLAKWAEELGGPEELGRALLGLVAPKSDADEEMLEAG